MLEEDSGVVPPPNRRVQALLGIVAVAVLAGNAILAAAALRSDATDVIGVEYAVTHPIQRLALGHPLYSDPEAPPFSLIQYTPLHYQMSAALIRRFGVDPHDPEAVTRAGRLVETTMWAAAVVLMVGWLVGMGTGLGVALALAAWWTTASGVWWFLNRPDSAETFLLFVALAMMTRSMKGDRVSWLWLATASFAGVAAGYAKQNGWFASAVYVIVLLGAGRWKAAVAATLLSIAGHAALHVLAWRAWGLAWYENIFGALDNGFWFSRAVVMAYQPAAFEAVALLSIAAFLAWRWRRKADGRGVLANAFPLLFAFAAVTALKNGSAENYFIDSCGVAVLLIGAALAMMQRRAPAGFNAAVAMMTVFLVMYAPIKLYESQRRLAAAVGYASLRPVGERLTRLLADKPGAWAFAADARVACFLPERTLIPQPLLAELAVTRRRFSYGVLQELVDHGELAVILFPRPLGENKDARPKLLGVSLADYHLVESTGSWYFYVHDRYPQ